MCIAREAVSSVEEQLWSGGDEEETPYFKVSDKLYAPGGRRIPTATSHVDLGRSQLSLSLSPVVQNSQRKLQQVVALKR